MRLHKINFTLNNKKVTASCALDSLLLDVLHEQFKLSTTRRGCGTGKCGSCTVYFNNRLSLSCLIPMFRVENANVLTIDGIRKEKFFTDIEKLFPSICFECSYCKNSLMLSVYNILKQKKRITTQTIEDALWGTECSCKNLAVIIDQINDKLVKKQRRI